MSRALSNPVRVELPTRGVDGRGIISRARAPEITDGRIGDFFIDTVSKKLYGPKTAAGWPDNGLIKGDRGWTGVPASVTDGSRRVMQIVDWQGGEGPKPATGNYIGATGLVDDIEDAVDYRGPQGPDMHVDGLPAAAAAITDDTQMPVAETGDDNEKRTVVEVFDLGAVLDRRSVAHAEATTVRKDVKRLRTQYYAPDYLVPSSLTGGASYRRVNSEPSHGGKIRTLDRWTAEGDSDSTNGGWRELAEDIAAAGMFGAFAGVNADQRTEMQAFVDYCGTRKVKGIVPAVAGSQSYRIDTTLTFAADDLVVEFTGGAYIFPVNKDLLQPVVIGGTGLPSRMQITGLCVDRSSYDGSTENIGIVWLQANQSTFIDIESRFSKYNHKFAPAASGGFGYNVLQNLQGIGGYYNFWMAPTSPGWVNENDFIGGRGFCTANTNTNLRIDAGPGVGEAGHNRVQMSLEGQGVQGIYDNGVANSFIQCRSEGVWSGGYFHVCGPDCQYPLIITSRYDYTLNFSAASRPQILSYTEGLNIETAMNGKRVGRLTRSGTNVTAPASGGLPALEVKDAASASGFSNVLDLVHGRDGSTSYAWRSIRASDGLVRSSMTTDGRFSLARQIRNEQSSWTFEPLILGNYYFWVDSTGRFRMKNGAPASAEDGTVIGTQT